MKPAISFFSFWIPENGWIAIDVSITVFIFQVFEFLQFNVEFLDGGILILVISIIISRFFSSKRQKLYDMNVENFKFALFFLFCFGLILYFVANGQKCCFSRINGGVFFYYQLCFFIIYLI